MKPRRNCNCACHRSGIAIHVVPCCDGLLLGLVSKAIEKKAKTVQQKTFPAVTTRLGPSMRSEIGANPLVR